VKVAPDRIPGSLTNGNAEIRELTIVRGYLILQAALLLGYMFLGRGFAHLEVGPAYVGDVVLLLGVIVVGWLTVRRRLVPTISWVMALLLTFAALGAARTIPYISTSGLDALRDGVLWGYAAFAVIVYLLVDRITALRAFAIYGWVVAVFAVWVPIAWVLFRALSADIDPTRPGDVVPLVFFKAGDMAVHISGAIAFILLGMHPRWSLRGLLWRVALLLPLLWTAFVSGTANRGALVTVALGVLALIVFARDVRRWVPLIAAFGVFFAAIVLQTAISSMTASAPTSGTAAASGSDAASASEVESQAPVGHSTGAGAISSPSVRSSADPGPANPDFERGGVQSGNVFMWTPRAADVEILQGGAKSGERYAAIGNPRDRYNATLRSTRFPFSGGEDISVTAWARAIEGRPGLEIYVNWYDRAGDLIESQFVAGVDTLGRYGWQQASGVLESPDDAARADILLYESKGDAILGVDAVEVAAGNFIEETPPAVLPERRPATLEQMIDNLVSIFGSSEDVGLEGTKQFRLAWWGDIVDYTVFGEYFWSGKGFGVNLADDDGYQSTADGSLRAPHNSHLTVLARMGVPGFVLWIVLQGAFAFGMLGSIRASRRGGDDLIAAVGAWVLVYWFAMMVDTSFDPYLEGPQGGIWFWTLFGLGMVIMRVTGRRSAPE